MQVKQEIINLPKSHIPHLALRKSGIPDTFFTEIVGPVDAHDDRSLEDVSDILMHLGVGEVD